MDEHQVRQRVRELVVEWAPGPIRSGEPTARLQDDLGYDSLSLMELAAVLEYELGLGRPSLAQAGTAVTVADVESLVSAIVMSRRGSS